MSSFQPEDRRDWVKSLLKAAAVEETQEELDIKEAARFAAERWGGLPTTDEDQNENLIARIPAPLLGQLDRGTTMKRLDSSSALITVDGAESAISWRLRLMQLRALNSNAGNTSGRISFVYLFKTSVSFAVLIYTFPAPYQNKLQGATCLYLNVVLMHCSISLI